MLWEVVPFFFFSFFSFVEVTFDVAVEDCIPNSSDVLSCRVNEVNLNFWCCQFEQKQLSFLEAEVLTVLDEGENL